MLNFEGNKIRSVGDNNNYFWFCRSDISEIFDYSEPTVMYHLVPKEFKKGFGKLKLTLSENQKKKFEKIHFSKVKFIRRGLILCFD